MCEKVLITEVPISKAMQFSSLGANKEMRCKARNGIFPLLPPLKNS